MSELKPFVARKIDDGACDPMPCVEVYLKSEADKVIEELKDKLQNVSSLLKETREWLVESQKLHKRCADNAVKVIAELQAQKAQAEDDCAYWKALAQKRNLTQPTDRSKDNKMDKETFNFGKAL